MGVNFEHMLRKPSGLPLLLRALSRLASRNCMASASVDLWGHESLDLEGILAGAG